MGTTTNQQFQIVLSHRDKPLAFMAMVNGQKVYFWDKSFMNAPAHSDLEFFLEEIYTAITEIMELPHGWLKFPRYERQIARLMTGVDCWPDTGDRMQVMGQIINEGTRNYVELYGLESV